ncbi:MAG TPA: prolipoprotein diacylglyceryl transferase [Candidatus Acidoferrum sp.]|nr:prolipoprotein diacylglyceryl transferase [Candidatus Acidoferrum sp.]
MYNLHGAPANLMIPFLHIGPLSIPTYGLMVALGLICAAYILQADFDRRGVKADAFTMITIAGLAGIFGSKLYSALESPAEFIAHPLAQIFNRYGFTWFGGFLGGFFAMLILGRRAKIPLLEFLDACTPAASVGYAIGRMGCLLSGDGDYGTPTTLPWGMSFPNGVVPTTDRVHPTPVYEFLVWCAIGAFLWYLGSKALRRPQGKGLVFCAYLILTGIARYLVEIIRINPRVFLGLTNAQIVSILSVLAGIALFLWIKSRDAAPEKRISPR